MPTLERRMAALEAAAGPMREPLLILRRIVTPGNLDMYPSGTLPAPPHLPGADRMPGEGWEDFSLRLVGMISHLPTGTTVRVVSR